MLPGKQELIISTYSMAYIEENCRILNPIIKGRKMLLKTKIMMVVE